MHNLDELLAEWRRAMQHSKLSSETVDELEDHLAIYLASAQA